MGEFLIDVATVQWAYFGLLIAFTICLAMLLPLTPSSGLKWWLLSNLTTAAAMPLFIWRPLIQNEAFAFLLPTTLVVISAALKLLAVSSRGLRRQLRFGLAGTIAIFAACYHIFDEFGWDAARFGLSLGFLSLLTAAIALAARNNPIWVGVRGRNLLIGAFAISSAMLALIAIRSLTSATMNTYFSQGMTQSVTFAMNIIQVIIVHIGFIAVVVGRLAKITAIKSARRQQLVRRRQLAVQHAHDMEQLAQERRALLDLLSHEVRQPLNNAQAALQEISRVVGDRKLKDVGMAAPVLRLYNIIDQVVLALSNAIVGANVIERRTEQQHREVELTSVAELARGDCPIEKQGRIVLSGLTDPVFIQGDPILLRLAFRNLLDNALKFSAPDTPVRAAVRIDPKRLGVVFEVFNQPSDRFHPEVGLFDRARRGADVAVAGKGLGLFIVQEVAQIHKGTATARVSKNGQTCFELFLPL